MKILNLILVTFFTPLLAQAAGILIQAPGTSPVEFQKVLSSQSHLISYTQSRVEAYQTNTGQEDRIYSFSDEIPFSISRFLQNIRELRAESPLSATSWSFLADFLPRVEISTVLPSQRAAFQDLICQAQLFTGKSVFMKCNQETISLRSLKSVFPQLETLYVEGRSFSLEDQLALPKTSELHWVLLSNSYKEIHFWGSFEQLRRQQFRFEELVSGSCDAFSMKESNFDLTTRGSVFFSSSCLRRASEPIKEVSWMDRNKYWVIPVGAALVGAAAYQMKDRPMIIEMPSLR